MTQQALTQQAVQQIASAPGDLPQQEIDAREALKAIQFRHDNMLSTQDPAPDEPVVVTATSGAGFPLLRAELRYTVDASQPDGNARKIKLQRTRVIWEPRAGFLTCWEGTIPGQPAGTRVRYQIAGWSTGAEQQLAHDGHGMLFRYTADEEGITTFAYRVTGNRPAEPDWMAEAVIYQVFLDRFHPGTPDGRFPTGLGPRDKHGGTLDGVRYALPYLQELGINCLWLSPVNVSDSFHGYDATDYFNVEPALGGNVALARLVEAAHARGIRVLLDFVPSHCSWHHPAFVAAQQDRNAPSYSWFVFEEWPSRYRNFLQRVPSLVSFNTNDAGARQHLIDSAVHFVRDYAVDGFRLDHVIGPGKDFWAAFQSALEEVQPDVVTIGEATDTPDALLAYRGRMNSVLDFPLARALRLTFAAQEWDVATFDAFLDAYEAYMASGPGRVSFLDNHDMDRFLHVAGNDTAKLRLAALCLLTLPGAPVIYYGTEIGLTQRHGIHDGGYGGDAEARRDMPWDPARWDTALLEYFKGLIALRKAQPVLRSGQRLRRHVDSEAQTYLYSRADAGTELLVVLNLSNETRSIPLAPPASATLLLETCPGSIVLGSTLLELAPQSGGVLHLA